MTGKIYKIITYIVQIYLPVVGTVYLALDLLFGLADPVLILGIIIVVDTILGIYLFANSDDKYVGIITVKKTEEKTTFSLILLIDPEDLETIPEATFRIKEDSE